MFFNSSLLSRQGAASLFAGTQTPPSTHAPCLSLFALPNTPFVQTDPYTPPSCSTRPHDPK